MRGTKANKADDKKRNLSVFFSEEKQQLERISFKAKNDKAEFFVRFLHFFDN